MSPTPDTPQRGNYDEDLAQEQREFVEQMRSAGSEQTRKQIRKWHQQRLVKLKRRHGVPD